MGIPCQSKSLVYFLATFLGLTVFAMYSTNMNTALQSEHLIMPGILSNFTGFVKQEPNRGNLSGIKYNNSSTAHRIANRYQERQGISNVSHTWENDLFDQEAVYFDWQKGLDVRFEHEELYKNVNVLAQAPDTRNLLLNISDIAEAFRIRGIFDYTKKTAVNGSSAFEPLPDFVNPCWRDRSGKDGRRKYDRTPGTVGNIACVPGVFIAGFPKSGTTDLHQNFVQHHQIFRSAKKEIFFWNGVNKSLKKNFYGYIQEFKMASFGIERQSAFISSASHPNRSHTALTVDATPATSWRPSLFYHSSGLYIRALIPDAKIIFILRDPVERCISHFKHFGRRTARSMYEQVNTAVIKLKRCIRTQGVRTCAYHGHENGDTNVLGLRVGMYYVYLKEWLDLFPANQIFVIKGEEYYKSRTDILEKVFQFLNLEPMTETMIRNVEEAHTANKENHTWRAQRIQPDHEEYLSKVRVILREFYRPFNERLAKLLGDDKYLDWNK